MLENSIWRQYHDTLDIHSILCKLYEPWEEMEIEEDELFLHNTLKAKLTKKEFRLFAMLTADVDKETIKERFSFDDEALEEARRKLYKKLKQDKVRLAFRKSKDEGEYNTK